MRDELIAVDLHCFLGLQRYEVQKLKSALAALWVLDAVEAACTRAMLSSTKCHAGGLLTGRRRGVLLLQRANDEFSLSLSSITLAKAMRATSERADVRPQKCKWAKSARTRTKTTQCCPLDPSSSLALSSTPSSYYHHQHTFIATVSF
ncbi:hypothetical protein Aduo_017680 [Ancylostoma duodenale]